MITVINLDETDIRVELLGANIIIKPKNDLWITFTLGALELFSSDVAAIGEQLKEKDNTDSKDD